MDAADYTVWRNMLNQSGIALAADGNGDGAITRLDFDVWKANFGASAGSGAHVAESFRDSNVPEPTSCGLAWLAVAAGVPLWRIKTLRTRSNPHNLF